MHPRLQAPRGTNVAAGHVAILAVLAYFALHSWPAETAPDPPRPIKSPRPQLELAAIDNAPTRLIIVVDSSITAGLRPRADAGVAVELATLGPGGNQALEEVLVFANVACSGCGPVWLVDLRRGK